MSDLSLAFDQLEQFDMQLSDNYAYLLVSHKDSIGKYQSCKIRFDHLAAQLNSFVPQLGIRSAAYAQSSDFATADHDHDIYTSATYTAASMTSSKISVMTMENRTQSFAMYLSVASHNEDINVYSYLSAYQPKLGALRMMGVHDMNKYSSKVNYRNTAFTGWVKADGSTYSLNDFYLSSKMASVFQTTGTTFTVPLLTDFIEINTVLNATGSYQTNAGSVGLSSHSHQVVQSQYGGSFWAYNTTDTQTLNSNIMNIIGNWQWRTNGDHNRHASFKFHPISSHAATGNTMTINLEPDATETTQTSFIHAGENRNHLKFTLYSDPVSTTAALTANSSEAGTDDIPYPSHNLVPALIYVGPSRYIDFNQYVSII